MPYIGTPPARRILSSSDIEKGAVTLDDINFTDVPANMDISGTIDKHTMRLADGVTITGDVTISEDLVLAKLSDDGDAITMTPDSTTRTITGSGSIQAATIAQTPQPTQTYAVGTTLTGLTGVIGSEVTGGAGLIGAQASVADGSITLAKMAADSIDSDQYVNGSIDTDHIGDDQVTLAKMATGTDGQIITYDESGNPIAVGPGTDGQVLTSTGAGSPPAFEDAAVTLPAGSCLKVSSYAFGTAYSTSSMSWQNAGNSVTHQVTNAGCALLVLINNMSIAITGTASNVFVRIRILIDGTAYSSLQTAIKTGGGGALYAPVSFNDYLTSLSLTASQNVVFQPQIQSSNSYYTAKLGDPYTNGRLTVQEIKQ